MVLALGDLFASFQRRLHSDNYIISDILEGIWAYQSAALGVLQGDRALFNGIFRWIVRLNFKHVTCLLHRLSLQKELVFFLRILGSESHRLRRWLLSRLGRLNRLDCHQWVYVFNRELSNAYSFANLWNWVQPLWQFLQRLLFATDQQSMCFSILLAAPLLRKCLDRNGSERLRCALSTWERSFQDAHQIVLKKLVLLIVARFGLQRT